MTVELRPIGHVVGGRTEVIDDDWAPVESVIALDGEQFGPDVTAGLGEFSHLEVVYLFHLVDETTITTGARRPRDNPDWPLVGIFAQRAKARPNRLGLTTCEILAVDGLQISVRGLDAVDGTPVVDLKPYMNEFAPRTAVRQPPWARALMANYW